MPSGKADRRHDLDWLRVIAIFILLFYHTGMLFNPWGWHIKNTETSVSFTYWMSWLHYWRMPLLLFISGAGTFLAMRKRTTGQYLWERTRRLVIPLLAGMFFIVPPQIYYEHIDQYENYGRFYRTVLEFVPYPEGSFSWHHLWFIAYLFLYSLLGIPLLMLLKSGRSAGFDTVIRRGLSGPLGLLLTPALLLLGTQILLRPWFPEETHALVDDWAFFVFYLLFFLFGVIGYSQQAVWASIGENRWPLLAGSIAVAIPFYGLYLHFRDIYTLPVAAHTAETMFDVVAIIGSWVWVVTVIAWGQRLLNRPHPWLKHFNEGLYPFYILHQTVIIVVGYYICQLPWSIAAKFWGVAFLTLLICVAFYFAFIRPFGLMRLFFGMKPARGGKSG